jgi:hypothetical protein
MARERSAYSPEFRDEAVRLVIDSGRPIAVHLCHPPARYPEAPSRLDRTVPGWRESFPPELVPSGLRD